MYGYRILLGKPLGTLGTVRQRRNCDDNIKMNLKEVGYENGMGGGCKWLKILSGSGVWH